jgi:hypothetical protein
MTLVRFVLFIGTLLTRSQRLAILKSPHSTISKAVLYAIAILADLYAIHPNHPSLDSTNATTRSSVKRHIHKSLI